MARSALVLGAGIMGLSTAWALRRRGWDVEVVDQDPVPNPRGASCDHHRLIRHAYGGAAGYMRMVDPAHAAWDLLWRDLGETHYVETGVLALASARGTGWMTESRVALTAHGMPPADLDAAAIAARFPMFDPAGIAEGFHLPRGGVLLAERILAALVRRCAERGVAFRRARVTEADPERGWLHLDTGEAVAADMLVLAAGPWGPRLLPGLAGRVAASRQIVLYLEPPPALRGAWADAPMLLDKGTTGVGFYAVPPVAGTPLKLGDHRFSLSGNPEAEPREASAAERDGVLALAAGRLRDLGAYRVLGARACYYDVEPEERFILAPLGAHGVVMSGFSGHGFKFGALLGLAMARALGDPDLAAALPAWAAGQAPPPPGLLADLA
ncbi:MAG: FAD-dependent oxidoreductase [Acetobacteraceae bacterium]|nr:FAD-dependent oxidoreductase [Acetobacteraceae bacterium]